MVYSAGWCFNLNAIAGVVAGCSPPHTSLLRCRSSPTTTTAPNFIPMATSTARIAVVGDVHDDWDFELDSRALQFLQVSFLNPSPIQVSLPNSVFLNSGSLIDDCRVAPIVILQPDLVLFTGDFGNENVELVRCIARVNLPKAVILGNHDSWKTHQFSNKEKDAVQLQLECLGDDHVGYKRLEFPMLKLSVVGGRPFSCGGNQLFRKQLLTARYGVTDMNGSAKRICRAAAKAPTDQSLVFLAHNGPTGLGSHMNDICGRDWIIGGGDHGDPDLAQAISEVKSTTKHAIPLVVFGHMHKELRHGGKRKMISIGEDKTIYLNGAIVPRVKKLKGDQGATSTSNSKEASSGGGTARAFTLIELVGGKVTKIAETWVSLTGGGDCILSQEEHVLFNSKI